MFNKLVFVILIFIGTVEASQNELVFKISSKCVESISVQESNFDGYWNIYIELTESVGSNLYDITKANLGNNFIVVDGQGKEIGMGAAILRAPLSRKFRMTGFNSLVSAKDSKAQILANNGICGFAHNKPIKQDK